MISLQQCDVTGCRVIGSITELGKIGPKHHGIILGVSQIDNEVYVAEKVDTGNQIVSMTDFQNRYSTNGKIEIRKNDGKLSDLEVAQRAISEIVENTHAKYDLVANNCESFSNRAMYGHSVSGQVVTAIGCLVLAAGAVYILSKTKSA